MHATVLSPSTLPAVRAPAARVAMPLGLVPCSHAISGATDVVDPDAPLAGSDPAMLLYHGTRLDGPLAIRDGFAIHLGTRGAARARLRHTANRPGEPRVVALRCAPRRVLAVELDSGYWDDPYFILEALTAGGGLVDDARDRLPPQAILAAFGIHRVSWADGTRIPPNQVCYFMAGIAMSDWKHELLGGAPARGPRVAPGRYANDRALNQRIRQGLLNLGYDAVSYVNGFEARGSVSLAVLDARVLREVGTIPPPGRAS